MSFRRVIAVLAIVGTYTSVCLYAQNKHADSLLHLLRNHPNEDTIRIQYQIDLVYALFYTQPDTALILATQALKTAKKLQATKKTGNAYHASGVVYMRKGNEVNALDMFLKAIPYFEQAHDALSLTVTYRDIASLYQRQEQTERALDYYQKAYKYALKSQSRDEMARQLTQIAVIYNKNYHKRDTAMALLQEALQVITPQNNIILKGEVLENMGYVKLGFQKHNEAIQLFNQALTNYQRLGAVYQMANARKALALAFKYKGDIRTSLQHGIIAMNLAQQTKDNSLIRGIAFLLSNDYEKQGDYKKSLYYQRMGEQAKDSIYSVEKTLILNNLQTKFDIANQQRAIDLLNKNKRIQEQELKRKTYERNALIIGTILLGGMAFLLYQYIRYQRQNHQLLKDKNQEIEYQKEQLIELNATKDKLFSIISHDIRSPLNSLEATLELLEHGYLSVEEMQTIAPELRRKVHTTSGLLTNILHWAKSQMEGIVTNREPFRLQPIAEELINTFQLPAQDKQILLECQIPSALQVNADRNMASLIIRNLVSNAIKFTPAGGKVVIRATSEQDYVVIMVKDTGKGMTQEQKSRLFDMKTHFSTSGTSNEEGTGLGLLLCKEFAEKNEGKIWVESQPDQGSCFFVSLPAA